MWGDIVAPHRLGFTTEVRFPRFEGNRKRNQPEGIVTPVWHDSAAAVVACGHSGAVACDRPSWVDH